MFLKTKNFPRQPMFFQPWYAEAVDGKWSHGRPMQWNARDGNYNNELSENLFAGKFSSRLQNLEVKLHFVTICVENVKFEDPLFLLSENCNFLNAPSTFVPRRHLATGAQDEGQLQSDAQQRRVASGKSTHTTSRRSTVEFGLVECSCVTLRSAVSSTARTWSWTYWATYDARSCCSWHHARTMTTTA